MHRGNGKAGVEAHRFSHAEVVFLRGAEADLQASFDRYEDKGPQFWLELEDGVAYLAANASVIDGNDKGTSPLLLRLPAHLFGRGGGLLGAGRRLLGHLVYLGNSPVDLADSLALFLRSRGDFGDQILEFGCAFGDLAKGLVGFASQPVAAVDFLDRILDQARRVLGRLGGPHGQVAHLVGHYGESGTRLPGQAASTRFPSQLVYRLEKADL